MVLIFPHPHMYLELSLFLYFNCPYFNDYSALCMLGFHWVCTHISLTSCDMETMWVFSFDQCLYHLLVIFLGQACLFYKGNMIVKSHCEEENAAWLRVLGVLPV